MQQLHVKHFFLVSLWRYNTGVLGDRLCANINFRRTMWVDEQKSPQRASIQRSNVAAANVGRRTIVVPARESSESTQRHGVTKARRWIKLSGRLLSSRRKSGVSAKVLAYSKETVMGIGTKMARLSAQLSATGYGLNKRKCGPRSIMLPI